MTMKSSITPTEATALQIAKRSIEGLEVLGSFLHAGSVPVELALHAVESMIDSLLNGSDVDVAAAIAKLKSQFAANDAAADAAIAAKFGAAAAPATSPATVVAEGK